jgi:hypothetical protein
MKLETDASVGGCDIVEKLVIVLTDERFLVVAGDIMPGNTVIVHVVKNRKAGLICAVDVELSIVRLLNLLVPSLTPGVEAKTVRHLVRRGHFLTGGRPEPTIDVLRLKVTPIFATLEITQATAGPDVGHIAC